MQLVEQHLMCKGNPCFAVIDAALISNKPGFQPILVNGRFLKSENHCYKKQRAHLQSLLPGNQHTSHRLSAITTKRTRRVNAYLHTASRRIIDILVEEGISTLVLGKNLLWKQEVLNILRKAFPNSFG